MNQSTGTASTLWSGRIAQYTQVPVLVKLGMDGVFVGSGIFKSKDPTRMARAVVEAVENYEDYKIIGDVSAGLSGMQGLECGYIYF